MPDVQVDFAEFKAKAEGTCKGGEHPAVPLDKYPLLAWSKHHPIFGGKIVHLEDQRASVHQVAMALAETPSLEAVASKFGTSARHVDQAARYALACISAK